MTGPIIDVAPRSADGRKATGVRAEHVAGGITRLGLGVPGGQGESAGGIFRFNLGARPEESEGESK